MKCKADELTQQQDYQIRETLISQNCPRQSNAACTYKNTN